MNDKLRVYDAVRWIAAMAAADGVVSPSERKVIRNFAKEYNLDERIIYRIAYAIAHKIEIPEVELVTHSEMIGRKFEKFVVSLFADKKRFKLLTWRSDKISGKTYALENLLPDLRLRHKFDGMEIDYLIECKYRSALLAGKLDVSTCLKRYQAVGDDNNKCELFIALGLGGRPDNPDKFYIIPVNKVSDDGVIDVEMIESYLCQKTPDSLHNYIRDYFNN